MDKLKPDCPDCGGTNTTERQAVITDCHDCEGSFVGIVEATPPAEPLVKRLEYAINCMSIDTALNRPDFEIAEEMVKLVLAGGGE